MPPLNANSPSPRVPCLPWAICTIARSGSTWLSQLVASTGILGLPDEYLLDWPNRARSFQLPVECSFEDYLTWLMQHYSTPNGVFAVKGSVDELQPFFDLFPTAPCVWLSRENRIEQALSWHRAHDGNVWHRTLDSAVPPPFDYATDRVLQFHQEIERRESLWHAFFDKHPVPPLQITYEQLCAAPLAVVRDISAYLGIDSATIQEVNSSMQIVRDEHTSKLVAEVKRALEDPSRRSCHNV